MAITDLKQLLSDLKPELSSEDYVFCSLNLLSGETLAETLPETLPDNFYPVATFREKEALSVICSQQDAERHGFKYDGVMSLITLNVYSSLEAVGMTATISKVLTDANISAPTPISALILSQRFTMIMFLCQKPRHRKL